MAETQTNSPALDLEQQRPNIRDRSRNMLDKMNTAYGRVSDSLDQLEQKGYDAIASSLKKPGSDQEHPSTTQQQVRQELDKQAQQQELEDKNLANKIRGDLSQPSRERIFNRAKLPTRTASQILAERRATNVTENPEEQHTVQRQAQDEEQAAATGTTVPDLPASAFTAAPAPVRVPPADSVINFQDIYSTLNDQARDRGDIQKTQEPTPTLSRDEQIAAGLNRSYPSNTETQRKYDELRLERKRRGDQLSIDELEQALLDGAKLTPRDAAIIKHKNDPFALHEALSNLPTDENNYLYTPVSSDRDSEQATREIIAQEQREEEKRREDAAIIARGDELRRRWDQPSASLTSEEKLAQGNIVDQNLHETFKSFEDEAIENEGNRRREELRQQWDSQLEGREEQQQRLAEQERQQKAEREIDNQNWHEFVKGLEDEEIIADGKRRQDAVKARWDALVNTPEDNSTERKGARIYDIPETRNTSSEETEPQRRARIYDIPEPAQAPAELPPAPEPVSHRPQPAPQEVPQELIVEEKQPWWKRITKSVIGSKNKPAEVPPAQEVPQEAPERGFEIPEAPSGAEGQLLDNLLAASPNYNEGNRLQPVELHEARAEEQASQVPEGENPQFELPAWLLEAPVEQFRVYQEPEAPVVSTPEMTATTPTEAAQQILGTDQQFRVSAPEKNTDELFKDVMSRLEHDEAPEGSGVPNEGAVAETEVRREQPEDFYDRDAINDLVVIPDVNDEKSSSEQNDALKRIYERKADELLTSLEEPIYVEDKYLNDVVPEKDPQAFYDQIQELARLFNNPYAKAEAMRKYNQFVTEQITQNVDAWQMSRDPQEIRNNTEAAINFYLRSGLKLLRGQNIQERG